MLQVLRDFEEGYERVACFYIEEGEFRDGGESLCHLLSDNTAAHSLES